jgi:hypothetical protein
MALQPVPDHIATVNRPRPELLKYYVLKAIATTFAAPVLHCFQKKTQVTSKQDKAIAAARYRAVLSPRKEKK